MKALNRFELLAVSILFAAALAACDGQPGPAESAGRQIDRSANDAGKKLTETVDKVGEKIKEEGLKTSAAVDDSAITAKVKASIFAEAGLKTLQIGVETVKGMVTLSGSVDSLLNSMTAKSLAGAVAGVIGVQNNLVIKP